MFSVELHVVVQAEKSHSLIFRFFSDVRVFLSSSRAKNQFFPHIMEVLGATVGSLGAVLGVVLVAVRGMCQGGKCFWNEKTPTMSVKMKLRFWCTVDVLWNQGMLSGAYGGVIFSVFHLEFHFGRRVLKMQPPTSSLPHLTVGKCGHQNLHQCIYDHIVHIYIYMHIYIHICIYPWLRLYPPTPPWRGSAPRRFDPAVRKRFSKAMCRGVFYVVGRRCSRLSEVVFRFPRPCAEVFFMLSEGAVRGFRKWFFKAMCRGVVGRRCSRLSEVVFRFPRPCAEVFFMLSEGAVRGFRKWFFVFQGHVPRCFLCCRKALFEAFGSGFSRPCVEVLSEGAVRGFRKWFFKAMCRGEFGANPADEWTSVPC